MSSKNEQDNKDNVFVEKALQGDLEAFEMLVKKYQASLIALAANMLADADEACDIAQETFLQVYKNLGRFDQTKSFKTWLFSIAVKRAIDRTRKMRSFIAYFNQKTREMNPQPAPRHETTRIEDSHLFSPLLKRLNQRERTAISLKVNEGYTAKEIGEVLGCSESTARVHLFNARKRLKEVMK